MVLFDSNFLIRILEPKSDNATDRDGNPVLDTQARLQHLLSQLSKEDSLICVPTPVIAEVMALAGNGGSTYLAEMRRSDRFLLAPFDTMAAVEACGLIAMLKREQPAQPPITSAKLKFDCQIAAIAKCRGVERIFSDDKNITAHGKRLNIPVFRICDLESPVMMSPTPTTIDLFSSLAEQG